MINLDNATLIGTGPWIKNYTWQLYELDNKYYAIIMHDQMNKELIDEYIIMIQ